MNVLAWLYKREKFGGREFFGVRLTFSKSGVSIPGVTLAGHIGSRFLFIDFGVSVNLHRWKRLANGDYCDWDEAIAPDDWRNQPTRPNGLSWDFRDDTIPF